MMGHVPISKHGRDDRPPGTNGPSNPGGHDPVPIVFASLTQTN